MELFIPPNIDSGLIEEIVCKVKSEGLFDQFRRECLADVDTKPAYQNLQHRVETTVCSFLDEQNWNSQMNKNQLRERLRKLMTEKRFFEAGIERIVDQVVNPKLPNLVPKIEDVAYKCLGIKKPSMNAALKIDIDTDLMSPVYELEQVSPESEKSNETKPNLMTSVSKINFQNDGKHDDLESPAFEPIQPESKLESIKDDDDMDISDGDDESLQMNGVVSSNIDELKSNLSSISGLTSNDSNISSCGPYETIKVERGPMNSDHLIAQDCIDSPKELTSSGKLGSSQHFTLDSNDIIIENMNQDSVLSQVSSSSRLSIVTNNANDDDFQNKPTNPASLKEKTGQTSCPYGISEEAQMQEFNDSSSSRNSMEIDTDNSVDSSRSLNKDPRFDINREEIKFEGTERKLYDIRSSSGNEHSTEDKFDFDNDRDKSEERGTSRRNYRIEKDIHHLTSSTTFSNKQSKDEVDLMDNCSKNDGTNTSTLYSKQGAHRGKHKIDKNSSKTHKHGKKRLTDEDSPSSKRDDHAIYKEKFTPRQRSRSKDSNDGFTQPKIETITTNSVNKLVDHTSKNSEPTPCSNDSGAVTSHSTIENMLAQTMLTSQPVAIDHILTGSELDLKSFIGENRNDPIVSSIEQSLESKVKKPKVAENIFEAKRLMKIRKRIELNEQKKIEQATVLAKQYIRTNAANIKDDSQGIELEFLCIESQNSRKLSGPIISSSLKLIGETDQLLSANLTTIRPTLERTSTNSDESESEQLNFFGFDEKDVQSAKNVHQILRKSSNKYFTRQPATSQMNQTNLPTASALKRNPNRPKNHRIQSQSIENNAIIKILHS